MMTATVHDGLAVTGIGLVTPAGVGVEETWAQVCTGRPLAAHDPQLAGLPVDLSCRVPGFDPHAHVPGTRPWQLDRFTQFALTAAHEAVRDARLSPDSWDPPRVAVVLGSAAGGVSTYEAQHHRLTSSGAPSVSPMTLPSYLPNMASGQLAIALGARGPVLHTATACASGATALITAAMLLNSGACDIAVAGGSDAMITPLCAAAFAKMGALSRRLDDPSAASRPFDRHRDGFVLAEGAGVLVLEHLRHAEARSAPVRAVLAGYGMSTDARHPVAPDPGATGILHATEAALQRAGADATEVEHVNAHGTSTPLNDRAEALLLHRLFGDTPPPVTSVKGTIGHTMGAAGAIEAALTVLSVEHAVVPPTANFQEPDSETWPVRPVTGDPLRQKVRLALSNSFGFGGHNTVLAFRPA
jgi:3-oxoacyl-[acyl-carrier-protein] synthase II